MGRRLLLLLIESLPLSLPEPAALSFVAEAEGDDDDDDGDDEEYDDNDGPLSQISHHIEFAHGDGKSRSSGQLKANNRNRH